MGEEKANIIALLLEAKEALAEVEANLDHKSANGRLVFAAIASINAAMHNANHLPD